MVRTYVHIRGDVGKVYHPRFHCSRFFGNHLALGQKKISASVNLEFFECRTKVYSSA